MGAVSSTGAAVFFDPYGNSQGRIANHERGVRLLQHGVPGPGALSKKSGAIFHFSAQRMRVRAWVLRELRSRAKLSTCSMGFFETIRRLRTCLLGSDGHIRQDRRIGDALVFDGGDDGDVHAAGAQFFGALGGDGEGQIVFAAERAVGEAPDERRGVQVLNDGDAKFRHGSRGHLEVPV